MKEMLCDVNLCRQDGQELVEI